MVCNCERMKLRSLTIGLSLLATGTVIGLTAQQFASADVSSGDRPVLVPIDTCRIADTRAAPDNVGPRSTPLGPAETITIDAQQVGTDCTGQIPASATALSLNVTALNATSNSFLTIWSDGPRPTASALNPEPGTRVFNAVTTEVTATQTFQIYNNRGNVDVFVDINGYYDNHNHDDLYLTESEVDTAIANASEVIQSTVGYSSDPAYAPSLTRGALAFETTAQGSALVTLEASLSLGCPGSPGGSAWYYLLVDGDPVPGSQRIFNSLEVARYEGVVDDLAIGAHTADIGVECLPGGTPIGGVATGSVARLTVVVT